MQETEKQKVPGRKIDLCLFFYVEIFICLIISFTVSLKHYLQRHIASAPLQSRLQTLILSHFDFVSFNYY